MHSWCEYTPQEAKISHSPDPTLLAPETVWAERYTIQQVLGSGGMGNVYLAHDNLLSNRPVALKILHYSLAVDADQRERFMREFVVSRSITHPSVIRVYDWGNDRGIPFYSMEYLEGESLQKLAHTHSLKFEEICRMVLLIAEGLEAVHGAEIVHRDIKSSNIICDVSGGIRIIDFGVASASGMTDLFSDRIVGSTHYLAPELWRKKVADPQTDLYALGILCHELCSGHLPFDAESTEGLMYQHVSKKIPPLHSENPGIPAWFSQLVTSLVAKDPNQRPRTAMEVANCVRSHVLKPPDQILIAGKVAPQKKPNSPCLKYKYLLTLSIIGLSVLALTFLLKS